MPNQLGQETVNQVSNTLTSSSPTANAAAGGTPDQAKMAGTPAAKAPVTLTQRKRAERGAAPALGVDKSAAEQARATAESLRTFGSLGGRVENLIASKLSQAQVGVTGASGLGTPEQAEFAKYVAALGDPSKAQAVLENASKTLGVSSEELSKKFGILTEGESFKQAYEQITPDKLTLKDLKAAAGDLPELNLQDLASALGTDVSAVEGMSVADVDKELQGLQSRVYSKAKGLRVALEDPNSTLTDQQKVEMQNELQTLYASGMVDTEEMFAGILGEVQKGSKVNFRGKELTVEELLKDTEATDLIASVLADPTGEALKELETSGKENPLLAGIAGFVSKNKAALTAALSSNQKAFEEAANTQTELSALKEVKDPEFLRMLSQLGFAGVPTFATRAELNKLNEIKDFALQLNPAADEQARAFLNLRPDQLQAVLKDKNPREAYEQWVKENPVAPGWLSSVPPAQLKPLLAEVNLLPSVEREKLSETFKSSPELVQAVLWDPNTQTYSPEKLKALFKNKDLYSDIMEFGSSSFAFKNKAPDQILDNIFEDPSVTEASLEKAYKEALKAPGLEGNSKVLTKVKAILGDAISKEGDILPDKLQLVLKDKLEKAGVIFTSQGPKLSPKAIKDALTSGTGLNLNLESGGKDLVAAYKSETYAPVGKSVSTLPKEFKINNQDEFTAAVKEVDKVLSPLEAELKKAASAIDAISSRTGGELGQLVLPDELRKSYPEQFAAFDKALEAYNKAYYDSSKLGGVAEQVSAFRTYANEKGLPPAFPYPKWVEQYKPTQALNRPSALQEETFDNTKNTAGSRLAKAVAPVMATFTRGRGSSGSSTR